MVLLWTDTTGKTSGPSQQSAPTACWELHLGPPEKALCGKEKDLSDDHQQGAVREAPCWVLGPSLGLKADEVEGGNRSLHFRFPEVSLLSRFM